MFTMFCFIRLNFQSPDEVHVLKNLLSDFFVLFYIEIITGHSFTLYIIHSFSFYKRNETIFFFTHYRCTSNIAVTSGIRTLGTYIHILKTKINVHVHIFMGKRIIIHSFKWSSFLLIFKIF